MIYLENKNIYVIGVDHGYGNIKTAGTVTPTGLTAYDSEPMFSGNILEYGGRYYRIGEGHKEFVVDKAADDDFYLFTLSAVARELKNTTNANVHLAAGLPLTWVRAQRDNFRGYLLRHEHVDFRFNGKDYHIRFTGCSVYPQGYPALTNQSDELKGVNILADIGNGTMNVLYIVNKKPIENKSWTEKYGVNQCMIAAKNAVMNSFGISIDDAVVEQVIRSGKADIGSKYIDCITEAARNYTDGIFSVLRKYEYNPDIMKLIITGGGVCLVKNFGSYENSRVIFIDDICAAAKGYEFLAVSSLRRKGNA